MKNYVLWPTRPGSMHELGQGAKGVINKQRYTCVRAGRLQINAMVQVALELKTRALWPCDWRGCNAAVYELSGSLGFRPKPHKRFQPCEKPFAIRSGLYATFDTSFTCLKKGHRPPDCSSTMLSMTSRQLSTTLRANRVLPSSNTIEALHQS